MADTTLIAPIKFEFEEDFIKAEVYSQFGFQTRTVNAPLGTHKFRETLEALPFAYYLDNRQLDGSHVSLKEIKFIYESKSRKELSIVDNYETRSFYSLGTLEIAAPSVLLKFSIGDPEDSENKFVITSYAITIPSEEVTSFVFPFWKELIKEWDRQLKREAQQLSLFDLESEVRDVSPVEIPKLGIDEVDFSDYEFNLEDIKGKNGKLLTGSALQQVKLKLVNNGKAKYIGLENVIANPSEEE
jgi:hypothetical protein